MEKRNSYFVRQRGPESALGFSVWSPPDALRLGGEIYPIETDFRAGAAFIAGSLRGKFDAARFLTLWFPRRMPPVEIISDAIEGVGRFLRRKDAPAGKASGAAAPLWDPLMDADALFAAFRRCYGIDLGTEKMHWWTFCALLEGLFTDDFGTRVAIRAADFSGLPAAQRAALRKKKDLYRLDFSAADTGESFETRLKALVGK